MKITDKIDEKYIFFIAMMTALASSLNLLEMFIPKPLPFMKIGLSNIIVLILVFSEFYKEAIIVAFSKSIIGAFLSGLLFSPTFLLSLGGNLVSCILMIIFSKALKNITIFGVSVIGSYFHLLTQLIIMRIFIIQNNSILLLYPLIAVISILTGLLTGMIGSLFNKYIDMRSVYVKACV